MIPYDELVVSLQTWRARQGLPVAQLSGALTPPPVAAFAPPPAVPARAANSGSAPQRSGPPPAPPSRPVPTDETLDESALLDDAAIDEHLTAHIDESHYENEGDNFSIPFDAAAAAAAGHGEDHDESTSIGAPPVRPSDMNATDPHGDPTVPRTPRTTDDW